MKGSRPVPWPAGSKQNTPRGTSDNALLGVTKNAQNSAPNTKNIPRRRGWRCFLLVTFIVMPPDSISRALPNKAGGRFVPQLVPNCQQNLCFIFSGKLTSPVAVESGVARCATVY